MAALRYGVHSQLMRARALLTEENKYRTKYKQLKVKVQEIEDVGRACGRAPPMMAACV